MYIMRLVVFFDLPTTTKKEKQSYALFRKFLLDDGYLMEQYSVYTRVLPTREGAESHIARLKANLPEAGEVTVLLLTEKQYEHRQILLNTNTSMQKIKDIGDQLTLSL